MTPLILIFFFSFSVWGQPETTQTLPGGAQKVKLHWEYSLDKETKRLKSIEFDKKIDVKGEWLNHDEEAEIDKVDLNFDKKNDYAITLRRGVANRYALYLLWVESSKSFISLGEQAELSIIGSGPCWSGSEKDGQAQKAINLMVKDLKLVPCKQVP